MDTFKITGKPDKYLLVDGMFTCGPCTPPYTIKADGSEQKVTGHAYYDTVSVKVLDANTVQMTTHAGGRLWAQRKYVVAADGKTMSDEFVSYEGSKPANGKINFTRAAPSPSGAHALSGSWQADPRNDSLPSDFTTVTFVESSDGLKMNLPNGQSSDATFDGKEYLTAGDTGKTMVPLQRIDARTIKETDTRAGKVTDVVTFKVSTDGKTMHVIDEDPIHGTTVSFTAEKKTG
jgi:hypothetical protein